MITLFAILLVIGFQCMYLMRANRRLRRELLKARNAVPPAVAPRQLIWRYGDERCVTCRANNWASCGHRGGYHHEYTGPRAHQ